MFDYGHSRKDSILFWGKGRVFWILGFQKSVLEEKLPISLCLYSSISKIIGVLGPNKIVSSSLSFIFLILKKFSIFYIFPNIKTILIFTINSYFIGSLMFDKIQNFPVVHIVIRSHGFKSQE
jgi:hypothetical protein